VLLNKETDKTTLHSPIKF